MAVYRQDRRRRITLVLLIVTSLALITFDQRDSEVVRSIRSFAQDVVSPIQGVADDAISPVTDFFDSIGQAGQLRDENAALRRTNADLRSQLAANQDALAEANAVRDLLDLPRFADYDSVFATVVDGSTGNFERTFQIDKGTNDGLAEGMPVVVGAQGARSWDRSRRRPRRERRSGASTTPSSRWPCRCSTRTAGSGRRASPTGSATVRCSSSRRATRRSDW